MKRLKVFFFNSLLLMISSIILQTVKLSFNIYISNRISPEALGVFQLIMATYYFGITLASSGISISCMKVVSEELAFGNFCNVKLASKKCIKISFIFAFITSFLFFINANSIVKYCFHSKVTVQIVYLICIALPLISVSSAITGYFIGVRRVYKTIVGSFLEQGSKILSIILLLKFFGNFSSIQNICFILILGDLISELVCFLYLSLIYFLEFKEISCDTVKCKTNFGYRIYRVLLPVSATSCIKSGISTIKQLLIPSSLKKSGQDSATALGEYGIISGMAMPIIMFPATFLIAVSGLIIPEFSRYYIKKDYKKIKLYADKLLVGSFAFSLVLALFYYIFANKLGVAIYHNEKIGTYIKIFSLLIPFMYVDIIIDNILKGLDAQAQVVIINILDLIVTTCFIVIFVPILGVKGYIISIFISEILNLSLSLRKLLKYL